NSRFQPEIRRRCVSRQTPPRQRMRNVVGPSYLFIREIFILECSRDCEIHFKTKWISARQNSCENSLAKRASSLVFRSLDLNQTHCVVFVRKYDGLGFLRFRPTLLHTVCSRGGSREHPFRN